MITAGTRYVVHSSRTDTFTLWGIGDCHIGAGACAEKQLETDLKIIERDPHALWIGLGDYADYVGYTDAKRFDPDAVAPWIKVKDLGRLAEVSRNRLKSLFAPVANKCLGLLLGNHEKKFQQHQQQEDMHQWLCTELDVANLGYCCFIDVDFCRQPKAKTQLIKIKSFPRGGANFRVFAHHGSGYAQTPGGKLNRLIQFMRMFDADIYFCGHVHDRAARRMITLGANPSCTKLTQRERIGMISGSYLRTYDADTCTYGEQKGYEPVPLGAARLSINPNTRELRAEI